LGAEGRRFESCLPDHIIRGVEEIRRDLTDLALAFAEQRLNGSRHLQNVADDVDLRKAA
jgi:hypothetical protein